MQEKLEKIVSLNMYLLLFSSQAIFDHTWKTVPKIKTSLKRKFGNLSFSILARASPILEFSGVKQNV